jgi:hypothetical protein
MLCDFYPIPTCANSKYLGLPISIYEISLIFWVTWYAADEDHGVNLFITILNIKKSLIFFKKFSVYSHFILR